MKFALYSHISQEDHLNDNPKPKLAQDHRTIKRKEEWAHANPDGFARFSASDQDPFAQRVEWARCADRRPCPPPAAHLVSGRALKP